MPLFLKDMRIYNDLAPFMGGVCVFVRRRVLSLSHLFL